MNEFRTAAGPPNINAAVRRRSRDEHGASRKRQDATRDTPKRKSAARSALPAGTYDDQLGSVVRRDVQYLVPWWASADEWLDVNPRRVAPDAGSPGRALPTAWGRSLGAFEPALPRTHAPMRHGRLSPRPCRERARGRFWAPSLKSVPTTIHRWYVTVARVGRKLVDRAEPPANLSQQTANPAPNAA